MMAQYSIEEIDRIVRDGAPEGANRSDTFHSVVGHFHWLRLDRRADHRHLGQFPDGIGDRYIAEGRLSGEVKRSAAAFGKDEQQEGPPWSSGWEPKPTPKEPKPEEPAPEPEDPAPEEPDDDEPELPPMYAHGDPDPRPIRHWAIKGLLPAQGHGLLSGNGAPTRALSRLSSPVVMTGQPFLGRLIKRQMRRAVPGR